jgi:hypothetical protein
MRMPTRTGTAHVVTTRRTYKDKVYCTHLLRRSYREDGKVKNETLGNLSHLPDALIDIIRRALQGETFVAASQALEVVRSRPHGHVHAVALAMRRLGLASVIASKPCRERDLVLAMVASRIVQPDSKLATSRRWHCSTLAEEFGVTDADEDELYAAMDWLLARQDAIEHKLAARHLREGALVLYDLSSSYFEGSCCPLAKRGYSRDGRPGTLQVNYGLLTDARGCPVAVSVFEGNTSDSLTFLPAVQRVRERFGVAQVVMVGDRGMVSQKAIDELRGQGGVDWITALKSVSIRAWSSRVSSSWGCSTSATWPRSPRRTIPASVWWPAATMPWPSSARTSARVCCRPPRPPWRRSRPASMRAGSRGRTRSACRWARSSTATRWPSTSSSASARRR